MAAPALSHVSTGIVTTRAELVALGYEPLADAIRRGGRVATRAAGTRASRFRGRGMEFAEVRAYQPGDDVRSIDWRVTARTGRPHSKLFEEERERPTWLLVDLGPSMRFGTRCAFKSVAAARAAALLAWQAHAAGERVGGSVAAPGLRVELPPGRTRRQLLRFLDALAGGTAAVGAAASDEIATQLERIQPRLRSGSRVVLVSDFYSLDDGLGRALRGLARRCDLTLVHVFDPIECTPPPAGRYRVSDGREIRTIASGRDSAWQRAIAHDFETRRRALAELARSARVRVVEVRTQDSPSRLRFVLGAGPAIGGAK